MNHDARVARVQAQLRSEGPSQLVVTNPLNVRWLTGFTGSFGHVVIDDDGITLITDSRYTQQVGEQVAPSVAVIISGSIKGERANDHLARLCTEPEVGFEAENLTVTALGALEEAFEGSSTRLKATKSLIADLRKIKDAAEIQALRAAGQIADAALEALLPQIRRGATESRLARQLDWEMAERGSERNSFATIFASGPNGAKPHARPSERELEEGDLIVIDFGATVDGYGSDMTRSIAVGGNPTQEQTDWYESVWAAQRAGVGTLQVGSELLSIHETTLNHLTESGQDGVYAHGTGHGVGLFIHEEPLLSPRTEGVVESSMAITVEPGAYIPGVGGIRVEDLLVTGPDGPECITNFPKGLVPSF